MLSSIRKPKRITIRGDDEKEYMFLVKGGEDLRLDQRIEQVNNTCVINVILLTNGWSVWLGCMAIALLLWRYHTTPW